MINTYLLTLLAPIIGVGNSLINSRIEKKRNFFSKDYTTVLKGLCCLIVIYVHVRPPHDNVLQNAIGSFAFVCVTIFFLISAYGMLLSIERNKDYLRNFWRNRLVALLIPCLLVNIVAFGLDVVNLGEYRYSILWDLNSYVAVLLQWCVWFYIVELCKQRFFPKSDALTDVLLIAGVIISSLCNYFLIDAEVSAEAGWCFERMGLVWGVVLYRYFDRFVEWMDKHRLAKVIILTFLGCVLGIAYLKYKSVYFWGAYLLKIVLGLVLIALLFTATSNRQFNDKISLWLGNVSYEVYLSHGIVMGSLALWLPKTIDSGLFILLTVIVTLGLSTVVHSLGKPIVNRLRTK